jgi:hypothetical protein
LTKQAFLKAINAEAYDSFAYIVALEGDTLVVGALYEDSTEGGDESNNASFAAGAVYVFTRSSGVWSQQAFLKASNAGASDHFGTSVALEGDTLVVGAPYEDSFGAGDQGNNAASNAGAAYLFTRSNGSWTQLAFLKATESSGGDYYGSSVAVDGDTLMVGAIHTDLGIGAAYLWQ